MLKDLKTRLELPKKALRILKISLKMLNFIQNTESFILKIINFIKLINSIKKDEFINDIKSDVKIFGHILNKLRELDLVNNDPKLKCLIDKIMN